MPRTAAALIIGNEILTGKIQETNVALLAQEMFELGIVMRRVIVCPDEIDTIAEDLVELRRSHDIVITSGGVGPTHDDVTLKAVAQAFECQMVRSPELETLIRRLVGDDCRPGHLRMADIPEGAELVATKDVRWPTVVMGNVYVLPGLPKIFRMKLPMLRERLGADTPFLTRAVYTQCSEGELAELLDRLDAEHPDVTIGSYPVLGEGRYKVKLTFDGTDAKAIDRVVAELLKAVPADKVIESRD